MMQLFDIDTLTKINIAYVNSLQGQSLKLFGVGQNELEVHGSKLWLVRSRVLVAQRIVSAFYCKRFKPLEETNREIIIDFNSKV